MVFFYKDIIFILCFHNRVKLNIELLTKVVVWGRFDFFELDDRFKLFPLTIRQ